MPDACFYDTFEYDFLVGCVVKGFLFVKGDSVGILQLVLLDFVLFHS